MANGADQSSRMRRTDFPPTHWSAVLAAGRQGSRADTALAELCRAYWYPLYAFARRLGDSPEDAKDLTQGFFEHLVEVDLVSRADSAKGRFRSFLLGSFKHFLGAERVRAGAQKRGGGAPSLPIDSDEAERRYGSELADRLTPEVLFDRRWAMAILDQALHIMEEDFRRTGRQALFDQLSPYLQGDREGSYADSARALGTTVSTVKVAVSRMRERYRGILREVTMETLQNPEDVEEELRYLLTVLAPQ